MPGIKLVPYLEENVGALNVELTPGHLEADRGGLPPQGATAGERYPDMSTAYF